MLRAPSTTRSWRCSRPSSSAAASFVLGFVAALVATYASGQWRARPDVVLVPPRPASSTRRRVEGNIVDTRAPQSWSAAPVSHNGSNGSSGGDASTQRRPRAIAPAIAALPVVAPLDRRPPRHPPAWLEAGLCADPDEGDAMRGAPDDLRGASALGAFLEERFSAVDDAGVPLLGECDCPFREPPPSDWAGFDCADYDWRILSDLAPFHGALYTPAALDKAYDTKTANLPPGFHFSIRGGRVLARPPRPPTDYLMPKLFSMLRTAARLVELPDVEFVLHVWDHAKVWRQEPIPVMSFIRDAAKNDITVPYPYQWDAKRNDFALASMFDAKLACPPTWEERNGSRVFWRGYCTGPPSDFKAEFWPTYLRARATEATRAHPDVLDAGLAEKCAPGGTEGLPVTDSMGGICRHRAILLLDGAAASGRSSLYMHAGAVLLKPDSVFSEWYYHLLRPWVHYVPVREFLEDLPEQAAWVARHAPPAALKCLRDNLAAFAKRHVNKHAVACYWWRLLTAFKRLQAFEARAEGFEPI